MMEEEETEELGEEEEEEEKEEEEEEEEKDEEEEEEDEEDEGEDDEEEEEEKKPDGVNSKKKRKGKAQSPPTPGVVYLSRVPPFMRPRSLRHLLAKYGQIGRLYLQPEDQGRRQRRRKHRGNRKRNYTEGWVEFLDKRVAKATALALNSTLIGGKKRYYYHDDMWNMKYLSKFHWSHLTEKIAYEQAVHDQRMRNELSQMRREHSLYLENVEKGKQIDAIVERKQKKGQALEMRTARRFKQRKLLKETVSDVSDTAGPSISDSLLRKIIPG